MSDEILRMATKSGPVTETFPSRLFTAQNIGSVKASAAEQASGTEADTGPKFNERQRKVLRFVLEGLSNKEISAQLQISESYVKAILQSLFQQTGVRTRGQLVRVSLEQYADQL